MNKMQQYYDAFSGTKLQAIYNQGGEKLNKIFMSLIPLFFNSCTSPIPLEEPLPSPAFNTLTIKGDSMAAGISIMGDVNKDWPSPLSYAFENDGQSGYPIELLTLDDRDLEHIIVFVGFNNLKRIDQPIESIVEKYKEYLGTLKGDVFIVGVPPMNHKMARWWELADSLTNERIKAFDDEIIKLVPRHRFINTFDLFLDKNGECLEKYSIDGIHPSTLGYQKIVKTIFSCL